MKKAAWIAACFLFQTPVWAETLEIGGGTVPYKGMIEPRLEAFKGATGIDVKFSGVGTGNGMVALIEGKLPVAVAGDDLNATVSDGKKAAQAQGKELKVPGNLVYTSIGTDEMQVVVHKSNPVTKLSKAQLKDIATGKTTNWKDVGGPDLPIKMVVTKPGLAPGAFFQRMIMDGAPYVEGHIQAQSPKEVITWVSRTPGGLGMASTAHMKSEPGDARDIDTPPLARPLGLITIGQPDGAAKKFIDFYRK